MLTRIFLPEDSAGWKGSYMKLRIRGSIDYPLAGVAVALKKNGGPVENARVAITAVNPAPLLVKGAENALIGKQIDEHVAAVVGELAAKMAKPLTTSGLNSGVSAGDCEGVCEEGGARCAVAGIAFGINVGDECCAKSGMAGFLFRF